MGQYHGKENLGSSYKYIMKVSPQKLYIPELFHFPLHHYINLHPYTFHHTIPHCMFSLLHGTLDSFPDHNPLWRRLENQIVGSVRPHPQMTVVIHLIERYDTFLFYQLYHKIKNKLICVVACLKVKVEHFPGIVNSTLRFV